MSLYRLVICEKPSVATSIAAVLNTNERKSGFFIGNGYIVTWCFGHLLGLAPPDAYGNYAKWRYEDLPIIPEKWLHIPAKGKEAQLSIIKELMNRSDVDSVINACDSGREGELIFREVYEYAGCNKKTLRLWISSMEEAAIKAGFDNLKDGRVYDNLYAAAFCREREDWLVGLNCTRAFSTLYGSTFSTGRVQSPTLAMLVKREADISSFVKEPFYTPIIDLGGIMAFGDRMKDKKAAETVSAACDGNKAVIQLVQRQKKTTAPPKLFDLTALQREANRLFGFTAQQTLDYAQALYEKAFLSYPRSDSKYLPTDMYDKAKMLVEWLQEDMLHQDGTDFVPDIDRLIDNKKVTDHHAIILTAKVMKADISALPSGELDLLNLVACRLLCAAAPAHIYEAVTVALDCIGYSFVVKGKNITVYGWKEIDDIYKSSLRTKPDTENATENAALPELNEGQIFDNVAAIVKEGSTQPSKPYNDDTLLSALETAGSEEMLDENSSDRRGLGTPATRAGIIEKIIKAGYAQRQKKNITPTDKGKNLIAVLPTTLTSPKLTAEFEYKLSQVEHGVLSYDEFLDGIVEFTKTIITENSVQKPEYIN